MSEQSSSGKKKEMPGSTEISGKSNRTLSHSHPDEGQQTTGVAPAAQAATAQDTPKGETGHTTTTKKFSKKRGGSKKARAAQATEGASTSTDAGKGGPVSTHECGTAAVAAAAATRTGTTRTGTTSPARQIRCSDDSRVVPAVIVPRSAPPAAWLAMELQTNHFQVSLNKTVYEYCATFDPDLKDSPVRVQLLKRLELGGEIGIVGNSIFLTQTADEKPHTFSAEENRTGMDIEVRLRKVREYGKGSSIPIQAFSALIRRALQRAGYQQIGRDFFDLSRQKKIDPFSIIPGAIMTVVPSTNGLALICDATNKVARDETALTVWGQVKRNREAFRARLTDSTVFTVYNNRFYKVTGVDFSQTPMSTFNCASGTISFAKYAQERYGMRVSTADQPMLECTLHGDKLYLIPEFCQMTGLTDFDRSNFMLMKKMTDQLFPKPQERMAMIQGSVDTMKKNTDASTSLNVSPALVAHGRIIPPPRLPQMRAPDVFRNMEFKKGGLPLKNLVVVWDEAGERNVREATEALSALKAMMKKHLQALEITGLTIVDVPYNGNETKMKEALKKAKPTFVLFVASRKNDKVSYSNIKRICTHDLGIPSQAVVSRNISDPRRGFIVMQNVVRQMAVKLGKCPWVMPFEPFTQGTMVFGLDVCHKTAIGKSVVGMCATLDDTFGRYINDFAVQDRGKEIVNELGPFVKKAVLKYFARNKKYPKNILFLRDGVGDGQLDYVNAFEMVAVKEVVREICPSTLVTFVVVKKRIHTRLFARGANPRPGTVVDDDAITHPGWYDFFLISHETRNGTVSPTHYNVLMDEIQWPRDKLQLFVYQLCFEYFNWDGSISVPAPCQYAHKMAFLYGQTLLTRGAIPSVPEALSCTLFQL